MSIGIARTPTWARTALGPWAALFVVLALFTSGTAAAIRSTYSIVDDYSAPSTWSFSRIGTDRGAMGNDITQVTIRDGSASVTVTQGWAGVWTSLMHLNDETADTLNPDRLLGPYVLSAFQPRITGVEIIVTDGAGKFVLELMGSDNRPLYRRESHLSGGPQVLSFDSLPPQPLKRLNWFVDGPGRVAVDEIRFALDSPQLPTREAMFLYSYGHLSQCYDPITGLMRDWSGKPVQYQAAVQSTGMFALASVVAFELGYISRDSADEIVAKTAAALTSTQIQRFHGLLPRFLANNQPMGDSEWSSVDTSIALISNILASQFLGRDTSPQESLIRQIDWDDLTGHFTHSASHGYDQAGNQITYQWDIFGGESFLLAVAFSAANPGQTLLIDLYPTAPTWDGSGFNDELGALLFPMTGEDRWKNDWNDYRCRAFRKQASYFSATPRYSERGLFGLSASEVPEPWANPDPARLTNYAAWGVGGHNPNGEPGDGSAVVGYPIVAPHYAAMVSTEHPDAAEQLFEYLAAQHLFSALNNVESLGIAAADDVKWNAVKGSWNLSLQTLGAGRSLSGRGYAPYTALVANNFLVNGYRLLISNYGAPCFCSLCLPARGGWRALLN